MTSPLVSVLLPVRDGGRFLADAIRSITQQTFADFEVVAVDDGSADDTRDLLDSWVRSDFRVTVIRQGALGLVPALETARRQARGEFLARMDADDVAEPRRLELQLDLLRRDPELVGCGCRVEYFPEGEVRDGARRYERWINSLIRPEDIERDLFVECPLAHPSFFLRSEAVRVVGGYRDPGWPEDYDLVMRLWRAGHRFGSVPEVLLRWRERPDRLSRTDPRYSPEAFRRCKVHYLKRTLLEGRTASLSGVPDRPARDSLERF